jgi:hypothetical protein
MSTWTRRMPTFSTDDSNSQIKKVELLLTTYLDMHVPLKIKKGLNVYILI